ncbi:hypothetical protein PFDG_01316, partial [Plasmodium falciparum Dd2]
RSILYIIFVVIPFLIFAYTIYKNVCKTIKENKKRNEFLGYLNGDNKQNNLYENFTKKYEIEKYKYYLKVERGIQADYQTKILDDPIVDKYEREKPNEQYLKNKLGSGDTIISDAYRIYHHNKAKAEEEKKKKEELKNMLKKQKLKEKKLKETTEKANLLAYEIIEEENSKKKKKKSK